MSESGTDTFTFCMLTPDGVIAQQRDVLLAALADCGFEVLGGRLLQLDWLQLGRMYHHGDHPPPLTGEPWELPEAVMAPLYQLAPACVLVLGRWAGDACRAMLAIKGATKPEEAEPRSLRAAGEHAFFNFVHCPDDQAGAASELAYLVGREDAQGLRRGAPHAGVAGLLRAWPAFQGPEALSFPHVAQRLRWRVVHKLAAVAPSPALDEAAALLMAERFPADGPAATRLAAARAAHPPIQDALLRAARAHPGLYHGLEALGELFAPDGRRRLSPVVRLRGNGIYFSELERIVLDGHRQAHWSHPHCPGDFRL